MTDESETGPSASGGQPAAKTAAPELAAGEVANDVRAGGKPAAGKSAAAGKPAGGEMTAAGKPAAGKTAAAGKSAAGKTTAAGKSAAGKPAAGKTTAASKPAAGGDGLVYLVRGDDAVLLSDAVRALVSRLVGAGDPGLTVEEIDLEVGDDHSVGALMDACLTPPFLTERRVVLGRNAGALGADGAARVSRYLDDPLDTTALVLVAGGGTVPPKLVAAVKQVGEVVDAGLPRPGRDRTAWLVERLRKAPVNFDAATGDLLGRHLGEDLSRLGGIVDILVTAYGEGAEISVGELEPFLGEAGGAAPWDLTDALDRGDVRAALGQLHRQLAAGDRHPLVVMSVLHRHYAAMLRLDGSGARSEQEAAALLGLKGSTFPARKAMTTGRKLGSAKILRAIALLAEADLDVRGAKEWPDTLVMEVLVARLCQLPRV